MKLLLDTSYYLSYFKIALDDIPFDFLNHLFKKDDLKIVISEASYSELVAKCFKISLYESSITFDEILTGIDSLRNEKRIEVISWFENPKILDFAFKLREIHNDFFDCIIFASAVIDADAIGTYDDTFYKKILKSKVICNFIKQINPEFEFWFHNFTTPPKKIII